MAGRLDRATRGRDRGSGPRGLSEQFPEYKMASNRRGSGVACPARRVRRASRADGVVL